MLKKPFSFNHSIGILLLAIVLLLPFSPLKSQNLWAKDIPELKLSDFQAAVPRGASHPVFINVITYYNFDSVVNIGNNRYKLRVRTSVDPDRKNSFFDQSRIRKHEVPHLLNHERGHVIIAFIGANIIAKSLNAKVYTADYTKEIAQEFQRLLTDLNVMQGVYDKATSHSMDYEEQRVWDKKLMQMFEDTCAAQKELK